MESEQGRKELPHSADDEASASFRARAVAGRGVRSGGAAESTFVGGHDWRIFPKHATLRVESVQERSASRDSIPRSAGGESLCQMMGVTAGLSLRLSQADRAGDDFE
jgi:hypothetical protein